MERGESVKNEKIYCILNLELSITEVRLRMIVGDV